MGALYYKLKKEQYRAATHPLKMLAPPQGQAEDIDPRLLKAMVSAKKKPTPDFSGLKLYCCHSSKVPNETELVAVARWALNLCLTVDKQLAAALDFLRWVGRLELKIKFAANCRILNSFFDNVLTRVFDGQKIDPLVWAKMHSKILGLVIEPPQVAKILACNGDYATVVAELKELVCATDIGRSLFMFAYLKVVAGEIQFQIDTHLQALMGPLPPHSVQPYS
jgi:hypothetical protein